MNDFDYDCMKKKQLARQAQHRKRGSKSKRCPMSTDHMTIRQWEERNGEIVSVNFDRPTSWSNFKTLSKDTQEEYLRHLATTYGANATKLAEMFDINVSTIRRHIQASELDIKFHVGHSMSAGQRAAWDSFLGSNDGIMTNTVQEPVAVRASTALENPSMQMNQFSLCFTGKIDADMIANSIKHILGGDASGQIEVVCSLTDCC